MGADPAVGSCDCPVGCWLLGRSRQPLEGVCGHRTAGFSAGGTVDAQIQSVFCILVYSVKNLREGSRRFATIPCFDFFFLRNFAGTSVTISVTCSVAGLPFG